MSEQTPRFGLSYIRASQAQKEVTHNAALNKLDALVMPVVEARGGDMPPSSPAEGQSWLVGDSPAEAWTGHARELAQYIGGAWAFHDLPIGAGVWVADEGVLARRHSTGWYIGQAIPDPAGGSVVDVEARAALADILGILRESGVVMNA